MTRTKQLLTLSFVVAAIIVAAISCNKPPQEHLPTPVNDRKIQFELFSDTDLSDDNHIIVFTAFIEHSRNRTVWDSVLPAMKIKDIPTASSKIVIQKNMSGDTAWLKFGFRYEIENVGTSAWIDSSFASTAFKVLAFNFR